MNEVLGIQNINDLTIELRIFQANIELSIKGVDKNIKYTVAIGDIKETSIGVDIISIRCLIKNINIFKDNIILSFKEIEYVVAWEELIGFDKNKIFEPSYIHKLILSSNARKFSTSNGLLVIWSLLQELPKQESIYSSLLSISSYRFAEDHLNKNFLGRFIIDERLNLCDKSTNVNLTTLRWLVSSGFTAAVIAIHDKEFINAEILLYDVIRYEHRIHELPSISMNLYSSYLLLAIISFINKKYDQSLSLSIYLFENILPSIQLIYNLNNRSVLSQVQDCKVLLSIGSNAIVLAQSIENRDFSKNSLNIAVAPRNKFLFKKFLHRFEKSFVNSKVFNEIEYQINDENVKE